jgi:hypothetical protein
MRMHRCGCRGSRRSRWRGASNDGLSTSIRRCATSSTAGRGSCARWRKSAWDRGRVCLCAIGASLREAPHDSAKDSLWLKWRRAVSGSPLPRSAASRRAAASWPGACLVRWAGTWWPPASIALLGSVATSSQPGCCSPSAAEADGVGGAVSVGGNPLPWRSPGDF